ATGHSITRGIRYRGMANERSRAVACATAPLTERQHRLACTWEGQMAMQPRFVCEDPNAPAPEDIFSSAEIPWPDERPLNVYAFDPSFGRFVGNYMTASVR